MKILDLPKYGPVHRFADYHVYRTLLMLSDGRRRGRKSLAETVNVGEGSMRTIIEFLRDKGYVDVKQTGIKITHKGQEFLRKLPIHMERLEPSDISVAERNVAVLVRNSAERISLGIEQRDAAIKAGADGATTIVIKGGWMIVPPDFYLDKEKPEIAKGLRKLLSPSEGDGVIVGAAHEYDLAEDGALAAAFALL
jgi:predicted transcriptional regulator